MSLPKLLLIEDSPYDSDLLLRDLSGAPLDIERCYTLGGGLIRIAQGGVDLILLDLALPPFHRIESLRELRAQAPNIPVIVVSGCEDAGVIAQAGAIGVRHCFRKNGLNITALIEAIRRELQDAVTPPKPAAQPKTA